MEETFGEFLKRKRLERRLSLRAFCAAAQVDPANYSKLERGVLAPPREREKLEVYERALGVTLLQAAENLLVAQDVPGLEGAGTYIPNARCRCGSKPAGAR